MSEIQTISFEGIANVRIQDQGGTPWFIAQDICKALGFTRTSDATRYLDDDEKGALIQRTLGGHQKMTTISESGLYSLALRSHKPEAKKLRKWITSVVLPAIRQHGGYINGQEVLSAESQAVVVQEVAVQVRWTSERHEEEKEARSMGLRALNSGRRRRKRPTLPPLKLLKN